MPTREEVLELIKPGIIDRLDVQNDDVVFTAAFVDDLKADSLDMVELVMTLEETVQKELGQEIEISDEEAEKVITVGDAVDLLIQKLT